MLFISQASSFAAAAAAQVVRHQLSDWLNREILVSDWLIFMKVKQALTEVEDVISLLGAF